MFQHVNLFSGDGRRHNSSAGKAVTIRTLGQDLLLDRRLMMSATPLAADFSSAVNNKWMNQIRVDGINLLQGSGFHIIGSRGTADDNNNVASESSQNSNGIMRPYQGATGGSVPYSLTFNRNTGDSSKVAFSASVGRSNDSFQVMNIPLEANLAYFNLYRQSNAPSVLRRYDQIGNGTASYGNSKTGNFYIDVVSGTPSWAEMIGSKYTIRVTISAATVSTGPGIAAKPLGMGVGFVNAPGLGGGIRDVEFGFGGLPAHQLKTVTGFIQVFNTDQTLLPKYVYEAESSPYFQIGQANGNGRSATASQVGYLQYGPYLNVDKVEGVRTNSTNLTAGSHSATFSLLVDNNTSNNNRVLTIDVFDVASGQITKLDITRKMFTAANKYQDFTLNFNAKPGQKLEFRVYSLGGANVKLDKVVVA